MNVQKLTKFQQKIVLLLKYSVFFIIIAVPYYVFFTTWLSSQTGGVLWLRAWKEFLLALLLLGSLYLFITERRLRKQAIRDKLVWLIFVYAVWAVVSGLFLVTDLDAAILGLVIQLRSFLIFIVAAVVMKYQKVSETTLYKLITIPAVGVAAFGMLQLFFLPYDFLKHFGYQKNRTIPPYFTIDEQLNRIRIASTLRGPNPLGVYLIAPTLLLANKIYTTFKKHQKLSYVALSFLLFSLIVLYGSQSRSAWLGLLAAVVTYIWLLASKRWKLILVAVSSLVLLLSVGIIYQYRNTNFVQDVVLHDNPEEGGEVSSNQGRVEAFSGAKQDIAASPVWGCGIGCAGPASLHNKNGEKIAENFYLQTVQELGLIGFIVLMAIQIITALRLFRKRTSFTYAWLAVFIGVSVASLLSHAWADDTIAYLWWAVAGLLLGFRNTQQTKIHEKS